MPNSFYRLVDIHIHGDAKVRALTPEPPSGRGLFKHLLICPELGPLPGVIRAGAATLAETLKWPLEAVHACCAELLREGLVQVDWKAGLIFLTNGIRFTSPNNASQVVGWLRHWNALPDSPLKTVIWERYRTHFEADAERRKKEIRAGLRDKKQNPETLLQAFLEHIAKPGQPATVPPPAAARRPEVERPERAERRSGPSQGGDLGSTTRSARVAEPLPGEHLLAQLAEGLQAAHPRGLAGGTDLHHALLRAVEAGDLRPDGTAAKPGSQSLTFSELCERHTAWCAAWASGASLPMNLANWINKRRGWREQSPEARQHTTSPGNTSGAESLAELADRHEESLRTLDWKASA